MLSVVVPSLNAAHVQTNVTFYGSIDAGVTYARNAGGTHKLAVDAGNFQPDRFGFRATEDLGQGLKAVMNLETGYATDTGAFINPNSLFNRQAYVGLSNRLGTLTLGHQSNLLFDVVGRYSSGFLLGSFYAFHPGNIDDLANTAPLDNAIKFRSADFSGWTFGAMYGFGEQFGNFARNRAFNLSANYSRGPVNVGAVYSDANNRALNLSRMMGLPSLLGQNLATGAAFQADKVRNIGIGGRYDFDAALLHAVLTQTVIRFSGLSAKMHNAELGANFRAAGPYSLNVAYAYSKLEDLKWHQFNVNNVYALSRRTELYALAVYQSASGDGARASINSVGVAPGRSQLVLRVGLHHLF